MAVYFFGYEIDNLQCLGKQLSEEDRLLPPQGNFGTFTEIIKNLPRTC